MVQELGVAMSEVLGVEMNVVHGSERLGDVRRNYSDTSKAKRMLGWQSTTALADGLRTTAASFRKG